MDIPSIDCIAILRDIGSFALLVQIIGRGLRTFVGKVDCLIYDFGGGTRRFGFVDDPHLPQPGGGSGPPSLKCCPECGQLNHLWALNCRGCEHLFPRSTSLSDTATSNQLLTVSFIAATYLGVSETRDAQGVWRVEHCLSHGQEALRARTASLAAPDRSRALHKVGARLLVKRIDGEWVKIIGG